MAEDMVATNGHQPGRQHEVDVDVGAADAHVLDDAHVDDADAAVRAARVVDLAQRGGDGRRGPGSRATPWVDDEAKAGGGRGARGVGGEDAGGAHAPRVVEVGAAAHRAPGAVLGAVRHPLPDVAGELLGAARARAGRVRGDRRRPAPARLDARAALGVEGLAPRPRAPVRRRAPRPPTRRRSAAARRPTRRTPRRPRRSRRWPGARRAAGRRACAHSAGDTSRPVARHEARERRVDDRPAADAHAGERRVALRARLAEAVGPAASSTVASSVGMVLAGLLMTPRPDANRRREPVATAAVSRTRPAPPDRPRARPAGGPARPCCA